MGIEELVEDPVTDRPTLTRRVLIAAGGATVLGGTAIALAACSPPSGQNPGADAPGLKKGDELAKLADVAVGGTLGVTVQGMDFLLAQPSEGEVVAFSAICTHQGCIVSAAKTEFDCPCHGSRYEAATGAVLKGPATRPLKPIEVTISGGAIVVA